MDMNPSELIEAGERLYGKHWRTPLATALDVDPSTVRRWIRGQTAIRKSHAIAIRALLINAGPRDKIPLND